jgi:hypothetical protein
MLHDYLTVRGKNGLYRRSLRLAVNGFRRKPTRVNLKIIGVHLFRLLLGDRLMNAVLSDRSIVVTDVYRIAGNADRELLYHFTPTDCVESILKSGLEPRDRYVYLTDDPAYSERAFLEWKTERLRGSTSFALLQIDARQLMEKQAVFCTDREHEFVTGKIDARFVSVVPDDADSF